MTEQLSSPASNRLLIIGSGLAANRLLEELDFQHPFSEILLLDDEGVAHYNRIMLSPLLAGEVSLDTITPHDDHWYRARRVRRLSPWPVSRIDTQQQRVYAENGDALCYDQLVIATGSRSALPALPGIDHPAVYGFRSLRDVDALLRAGENAKRAIVVGGGLLGIEAAVGLRQRGLSVTLLHRNPVLMNRQLDSEAAALLCDALAQRGIEVMTGVSPTAVLHSASGELRGLALNRQGVMRELNADLLVFATGIHANTELAQQAGLTVNRGIVVDTALQSSAERVFAIGECCEFDGNSYGLVAPIWDQVRVLAAQLRGDHAARYSERQHLTKLKVSGLDVHSMGQFIAERGDDCLCLSDPARGVYKKLLLRNSRLIGLLCLGDIRDSLWYAELLESGQSVAPLRQQLLFGRAYCDGIA